MEKSLKVNGNLSAGSLMPSRGKAMVKGKNKVRGLSASEAFELSVVVPFHADPKSPHLLPRLDDLCRHFPLRDDIEFIVVDSGSPPNGRKRCREICRRHNVRYLYHDGGQVFSLSDARNYGARYAKGRAVSFFDVDLRASVNFWDRLFKLMAVEGVSRAKKPFLSISCLLLTEKATKEFTVANPETRHRYFYKRWLRRESEATDLRMGYLSSVIVVCRWYYLSIGGHNPKFYGYGPEDHDLLNRLVIEEGILPKVANHRKNGSEAFYDPIAFMGRVLPFCQPAFLAKLFLIHLFHPRKSQFHEPTNMARNGFIANKLRRDFYLTGIHPPPLIDGAVKDKVLFIGDMRPNATHCLRDMFPLLGSPTRVSENDFVDRKGLFLEAEFEASLRGLGANLILFHNPRENKVRRRLYEWCREKNLPLLCCGRGVLADSWFFDKHGYGADSRSYAEDKWNKPLSANEKRKTTEYIKKLRPKSALKKVKNFCAEVVGHSVDEKTLHRFIYFLCYEFYSFAVPRPSTVRAWGNRNSPPSAIQALDFYEIRLPDKPPIIYAKESRKPPPPSDAIFEQFKSERINRKRRLIKGGPLLQRIKIILTLYLPPRLVNSMRKFQFWFLYTYFTISRRLPPGV